uniref:Uncharacterized protein n=1 Tax=virus sp. ctML55 TaxID=2827627 RepID=A0A8S5RIF3_9VIRU|nr:MAG TPA: hypothetical protein [virus sp. ctML55]
MFASSSCPSKRFFILWNSIHIKVLSNISVSFLSL